jgi:hypothetical protein
MRLENLRSLIVAWLSAAVIVAGLVPPAVRHTHPGGADPFHRHPAGLAHDHHSNDEHAEEACDDAHPAPILDEAAHLHFAWLGVGLTLPDRPTGGQARSDTLLAWASLVQLADEQAGPTVHRGSNLAHAVAGIGPAFFLPATSDPCLAICAGPTPGMPALLCDRARHARSGVQLI